MTANIPLASKAALVQQYVGKSVEDIPLPAAVLDIAAVKRNCERTLATISTLGWALRVAVGNHKTTEIARLQIGEDPEEVRILVSALSDAENLLPLLLEYQQRGLLVNVLYNVPISPSQIERIANLSRILGRRGGNMRLLVDHPLQIPLLLSIYELSGYPPNVYIAIDAGSRQTGVRPGSPDLQSIFRQIEELVLREGPIVIAFIGFYCEEGPDHNNLTLPGALGAVQLELNALLDNSPMKEDIRLSIPESPVLSFLPRLLDGENLADKLESVSDERAMEDSSEDEEGTDGYSESFLDDEGMEDTLQSMLDEENMEDDPESVLSEEAIEDSLKDEEGMKDKLGSVLQNLDKTMRNVKDSKHRIEVHASDYTLLDLNQLSSNHIMITPEDPTSWRAQIADMPLGILTEVTSIYQDRAEDGKLEVLIAAGTSQLGAEPNPYMGWGVLDPAPMIDLPCLEQHAGWYVQRAEKESAILGYGGPAEGALSFGQKVKIFPSNAGNASQGFGWYFVVDSSRIDHGDEIVDIFVRWRD